jgi:hypothetical protein
MDVVERNDLKAQFRDFLEQDFGGATGEGVYVRKVDELIKNHATTKAARLEVDLQGEPDHPTTSKALWPSGPGISLVTAMSLISC